MEGAVEGVQTPAVELHAVPDAVKPPPGNPRFPLVDGVRAIAVVMVVGIHAAGASVVQGKWWSPFAARLDIGVTVFFVLSGFLLYRPYVAARLGDTPRVSVGGYARRRALRILPAYWLALTLLAIYPGLGGVFTHDWWVYFGFLQIYNHAWINFYQGINQAWSLCVEVTFYAALPLLAALVARLPARGRREMVRNEAVLLGALTVASLIFRIVLGANAPDSEWVATLPAIFGWFAIGMALAIASAALHGRAEQPRAVRAIAHRPALCWLAALACFLFTSEVGKSVLIVPGNARPRAIVEYVLYGIVSALIVVPAIFGDGRTGAPRRVLSHPIVAWTGLVSYGVFLWHLNVIAKLRDWGVSGFVPVFFAGLAMSVAIAAVSYYLVERPLLHFKDGFRRPKPATSRVS